MLRPLRAGTIGDWLDKSHAPSIATQTFTLHLVTHALHFAVNYLYFVANAVRDPQDLCKRHPSLLLICLAYILKVSLSCQCL